MSDSYTLAMLVDKDADLDLIVSQFNKVVQGQTQQQNFLANNARRNSPWLQMKSLMFLTEYETIEEER